MHKIYATLPYSTNCVLFLPLFVAWRRDSTLAYDIKERRYSWVLFVYTYQNEHKFRNTYSFVDFTGLLFAMRKRFRRPFTWSRYFWCDQACSKSCKCWEYTLVQHNSGSIHCFIWRVTLQATYDDMATSCVRRYLRLRSVRFGLN